MPYPFRPYAIRPYIFGRFMNRPYFRASSLSRFPALAAGQATHNMVLEYKKEVVMDRRDFIKGTVIAAVAVTAPKKVLAGEYGKMDEEKKINTLQDMKNPSVLEQKHVPGIEAPGSVQQGKWFDVQVKVGFMQEHPSTPEHWITKIKLLINDEEAAKTEFKTGGVASPVATFRIKLDKTAVLTAMEHCNLHGTWKSSPVTVKVG
jgi:superoxide reductase